MDKPKRPIPILQPNGLYQDEPTEWDWMRYADDMDQWLTEEVLPVLLGWMAMRCTCHTSYTGRGLVDPTCMYHYWEVEVEDTRRLIAQIEEGTS